MRTFKNTGSKFAKFHGALVILLLLVISCSKELDEKKPDDFDRDVHPISLFDGSVVVETQDSGTELLSVKSDVASGIYALNEYALRPVKMISGAESLAPLFAGLKLESSRAGQRFKFNFKLTKKFLIAYMEVEEHALSSACKELVVDYQDKSQVAIFHYDIAEYGIVRNRPNDLDEPTRFIELRTTKKVEATHLKMSVLPENRILAGLRGHYDEDAIFLRSNLEARNWNLSEVAKLFHIQTSGLTSAAAKSNDKRAKIIDETLYIMGKTTQGELTTIEKVAFKKGDPRYTKCDGTRPSEAEATSAQLCVMKPLYSGEVKKVRLKLKKDEDGEILGTVDLERVTGITPSNFAMIDTNTLFTRFEYDERITDIENKYIYDFKEVHGETWQASELKKYLGVNKDLGTGARKTIVFDKMIWVQAPFAKSEVSAIELASIGKDQRFAKCDEDILALDTTLSAANCILKPVFMLPAAPMNVNYKFYDGTQTPKITFEAVMGEKDADFLVVINTLDLFDYTYARNYKDILFDKARLHNKTLTGEEVRKIIPALRSAKDQEIFVTKVLDSRLWLLKAQTKAQLEVLERAMAGNDPRFSKCSGEISSATGIALSNCYLRPIASVSIAHSLVDFEDADNMDLPDLEVRTNVDRRISTHLIIPEKAEIENYEFAQVFSEQEDFKELAELDHQLISGREAAQIFGITEVSSEEILKTKIVYDELYMLAPADKSKLHIIEQTSLQKDPRYDVCSAEIAQRAGLSLENCVLRPLYSRNISFVSVFFRPNTGSDLPDYTFDYEVTRERANLAYFKKSTQARKFEYTKNLDIADRIHLNKAHDFDLESEYLYVTMTHGTPRQVLQADPFYQGNEKLVHLRFTKEGLEVYEKDRDERFRNNALNERPVLLIPGVYEDYKCQEDANGNCLPGIQMDNELTWEQKRLFVPTFENLQTKEINTLDIFTVEADPCLTPNGVALASYQVTPGAINIELEKTYKMSKSWRCIAELYFADTDSYSGFSNGGFKVRFNYSMVRLKDLVSPDYEPVAYPIADHGEFGFFKNFEKRLGDDFDPTRTQQTYLLNRWNPKKKVITYHLSDTYNEKGQELIKSATYEAFDGINRALKKANAGIQLKLEAPSGKLAGDLRHNVLQLITDPLSNGLLGYAPTVTNPYTGEILQAHVNMYSGVIRSMSRRIWQDMVDLSDTQAKLLNERPRFIPPVEVDANHKSKLGKNEELMREIIASRNTLQDSKAQVLNRFKRGQKLDGAQMERMQKRAYDLTATRLKEVRKETTSEADSVINKHLKFVENRLNRWSENNAYAEEFFRVAHTAKTLFPGVKEIDNVLDKDGTLKDWNKLSSTQKKKAMDIIVPYVYTSTLVHEMGHSLGLRHNFYGSFDAENFYTEEEARALGMRAAPAYSSIMDYSATELNNLMGMGKYDIAALRFGYAREVELQDGTFVKVPSTLQELEEEGKIAPRKAYGFCTDENAGLSATCNRFDEGSTLVEIAKAKIEDYHSAYKYRNFRDDRDEYRAEDLLYYTIGRMNEFNRIRDIFEEWEFFGTLFGYTMMVQGCSDDMVEQYPVCKMINDRRDSTMLVADFFLEVLKTPDHLCAVLNPQTQLVEQTPLATIYEEIKYEIKHATTSCFDPAIVAHVSEGGKQVVAQIGKFLNGFKDNDPNFPYSNDRYTRGVWIDKIMAMKALYQRESGKPTTETQHLALIDHPFVAPQVENIVDHIMTGAPLQAPIPFRTADDGPIDPQVLTYSIKSNELIDGPSDGIDIIKDFFSLPSTGKESLGRILLANAKKWGSVDDVETREIARQAVNYFTVRKSDLMDNVSLNRFLSISMGEINYSAGAENKLATKMLQTSMLAMNMNQLPQELLIKVFQARYNDELIGQMTAFKRFALLSSDAEFSEFMSILRSDELASQEGLQALIKRLGLAKAWNFATSAPSSDAELEQVLQLRQKFRTVPADASDVERQLYDIDLLVLLNFINGPVGVEESMSNLKSLPTHIKEISL